MAAVPTDKASASLALKNLPKPVLRYVGAAFKRLNEDSELLQEIEEHMRKQSDARHALVLLARNTTLTEENQAKWKENAAIVVQETAKLNEKFERPEIAKPKTFSQGKAVISEATSIRDAAQVARGLAEELEKTAHRVSAIGSDLIDGVADGETAKDVCAQHPSASSAVQVPRLL